MFLKLTLLFFIINTMIYADNLVYSTNFNNGLDDKWRIIKDEDSYEPKIVGNKNKMLRLTNRQHDLSTGVTLDYEFPTKNNKFVLEFDYYAYGGCEDDDQGANADPGTPGAWGADGLGIVLFDSSAGATPKVGANGGSLGYANSSDETGFQKGWLGIGIDEFGNYVTNDEGRRDINGHTDSKDDIEGTEEPNSIGIRGDATKGYRLLKKKHVSRSVARELIDKDGNLKDNVLDSYYSGRYRLTVDSSDDKHLYITLERKYDGTYHTVISKFDAMDPKYHQTKKPTKFRLAFSSATGGACNIHEIDNVDIYGKGNVYDPSTPPVAECPAGYTLDTSKNYIENGDFHILDERTAEPSNVPAGTWLSKGTWKSDTIYQGNDRYPQDGVSSKNDTSSIIKHNIVYSILAAYPFPGDSRYDMGAQNALYSNGNDLGHTMTIWESKNINLDPTGKYIFVSHFSNTLYKDTVQDASNPKVQLSFKDSSWHNLGSPYEVPRDNTSSDNSQSSDKWYAISHLIEPTSSSIALRILDSAYEKGSYGDDLVVGGLGLYKCKAINQPKPFECTTQAFLGIDKGTNNKTYLSDIDVYDNHVQINGPFKKIQNTDDSIFSFGYNPKDNFIWGYNNANHKVEKVDANYRVVESYSISGLGNYYGAADVDKNGILYLSYNRNAHIERVDLNTNPPTKLKSITITNYESIKTNYPNRKFPTSDIAINPKDDKIYFIPYDKASVWYLDIHGNNKATAHRIDKNFMRFVNEDKRQSGIWSNALFFDAEGSLYVNSYKAHPGFYLYKIDIRNKKVVDARRLDQKINDQLSNADGARCALASGGDSTPPTGECQSTFPGAVSSTYDEVQINQNTKIDGTTNHTITTKVLKVNDGVECDNAPCVKSNTLASKMDFNLDLGNGSDGDKILDNDSYLTISSNKEYKKFQTGKNNDITINGDVTIKSQSDFYINSNSKIHINGNVVIYADKFDSNQEGVFYVNGSLKIYTNTFYLNSGNNMQHIPSADKFVVFAKKIIDINSHVDFKGIFYSDGDIQINDHTKITGALTANYIDINNESIINYDGNAVNNFCNPTTKKIKITAPKNIDIVEGNSGTKSISIKLTADGTIPSDVSFDYTLSDGTAKINTDYQSGGKIDFSDNTINIPNIIIGDKKVESDEYFYITLLSSDDKIVFTNNKIKVHIINDDIKFLITDCPEHCNNKIKTKIVKKNFISYIYSVDESGNLKNNDIAKDVFIRIIDNSTGKTITNWQSLDIYNKKSTFKTLVSTYANKNAKIELKWTNTKTNKTEYQTSIDNFAIRPKQFKITLPTSFQKAGDDFNFKVEAIDFNNNPSNGYSEVKNTSFTITPKDEKSPSCLTGRLTLSTNNFTNGTLNDTHAKYNNVGKVDITVEEKLGSEFAKVDTGDTPKSQRLIPKDTKTITFVPKKFTINPSLSDATSNITFYANNPSSMGANLAVNISATDGSGNVLSNYTNNCYAKDTKLTIFYTNSNTKDRQTFVSNKHIVSQDASKFVISVNKSSYNNGKTTKNIKLNLSRNNKIAKEPNILSISKIKADDGSTSNIKNINPNITAHFYYGRAHAPSPQSVVGKVLNAKLYYEIYCKTCDKTKFLLANGKASIDSVYWYILPSSVYNNFGAGVCDYNSPNALYGATATHPASDEATIHITVSKVPHNDRISYIPNQTYLQYNRFSTIPYPSNIKHFFNVEFTSSGGVWAGEGLKGKTVDTDISKIKNQSLEW